MKTIPKTSAVTVVVQDIRTATPFRCSSKNTRVRKGGSVSFLIPPPAPPKNEDALYGSDGTMSLGVLFLVIFMEEVEC